MTLKEVDKKRIVTVKKVNAKGSFKRRLFDMGFVNGTEVYIEKFAPLGDPMEIKLKGYNLSLRHVDANLIEVE
ncbi:ferrous iron transport protein A [Clostridiaceae bacterium HSG29]|nr:ferrous iron transport protein A [Clostridiaceae bacterium HSG29]